MKSICICQIISMQLAVIGPIKTLSFPRTYHNFAAEIFEIILFYKFHFVSETNVHFGFQFIPHWYCRFLHFIPAITFHIVRFPIQQCVALVQDLNETY